jgi:alpha-L-rhamnosidase
VAGYDDATWRPAPEADLGFGHLVGSPAPPVRRLQEVAPIAVRRVSSGAQVVDLGQNINGWVRLHDLGPAGTVVRLEHREAVDGDGEVTVGEPSPGMPFDRGHAERQQCDLIVSDGSGVAFEPRHTTHGFRYVSVSGHPRDLTAADVDGIVVATDLRRTGWFECSDERLNRLHEAARWSFLGNACDIPTDCPTRERAGWTGDWQVFVGAAGFLYDVAGFSDKWLSDLVAEQREDGAVANLAPSPPAEAWNGPMASLNGSAGWGDAAVIVPWEIWRAFGDDALLARQWDSMAAWLGYVERSAAGGRHPDRVARGPQLPHERYLWDGGYHWGEWLTPEGQPRDLGAYARLDKADTATAYFRHSAHLLSRIAGVLGRADNARRYAGLAENVREAWCAEFLRDDGTVTPATQANCVRALAFGLVPSAAQPGVAAQLARLIREAGNHLATGFLATPLLLPVLADHGHLDVAYDLLLQESPPSWLSMINRGATTMEELWEGVDENGVAHESLNHYSKGAVISFLHRYVAGLRPLDSPGAVAYRRFEVRPMPGGGLTSARATLDTPYGRAESAWLRTDPGLRLEVTVPPGTTALVHVPDGPTVTVEAGRHVFE